MRRVAGALVALIVAAAPLHTAPAAAAEPDNDKVLLVQGWTALEIRRIIDDFAALYGLQNFVYDLRPEGPAQRLAFPEDIASGLFSYLLNYLKYPRHLDPGKREIVVAGSATLGPGFGAPAPLLGQQALFYIPANDQDFDVVYVKVATQAYASSFEASDWRPVRDDRLPAAVRKLAARLRPDAAR